MPGPLPKPADRRQGRRRRELGVIDGGLEAMPAPEADRRWLKSTREAWDRYWESPSARLARPSHLSALQRMFGWRDRQERTLKAAERYRREAAKATFVEGSKGQPRLNPLFDAAEKCEAEALQIEQRIVSLEDRFGLSPQAELKLGVQYGEAARSLDELNRRLHAELDETVDEEEDPRIIELAGE